MAEITTLAEAVRGLVRDGDTVALEGFTHLIPHAAGHEVIRQGRRDLALVRMTPDVIYDQLIGAGCARKLTFSWGGNPGVGSLHRFRDAVAEAPGGAHPSYAHGYYDRDNEFYVAWDEISRDRETFAAWMNRHVLQTADVVGYRESLERPVVPA